MPTKKKSSKSKTTTNSNKNTQKQKVVVNVNTHSAPKKTSKRGTVSYTKGNSYLGGTGMRGVNYPSTTVINNMPTPPIMFPQMETNRITAIENGMNNLYADIQGLYGKLNAPSQEDVKSIIPNLTDPITKSVVESKASINYPTVDMSSSSSTSTPSFGGSTSSDDSSGGGNLPITSEPMYDASDAFETPKTMSMSVPTQMRNIPEFDESVGSPTSATSSIGGLTTQFSRMSLSRVPETEVQVPSSTVPTTIDVNPSSKTKSVKVKPEVKDEVKTEPISPPSSKGSPSSVNKPSKSNKKEMNMKAMKTRYDEIMDSLDYIQTKDRLMTSVEKEKASKEYHGELSDMYFRLHPRSKKEPKSMDKLKLAINKKLYVDTK